MENSVRGKVRVWFRRQGHRNCDDDGVKHISGSETCQFFRSHTVNDPLQDRYPTNYFPPKPDNGKSRTRAFPVCNGTKCDKDLTNFGFLNLEILYRKHTYREIYNHAMNRIIPARALHLQIQLYCHEAMLRYIFPVIHPLVHPRQHRGWSSATF